MLVSMSKWTAMAVIGTTFAAGIGGGWLLQRTRSGEGPALASTVSSPAAVPVEPIAAPSPVGVRPPATPAVAIKAVPAAGSFFRLGASDTLSEISRKAYGTTKRVADLQRANPSLDPKNLKSGTLIYVPSGREPVPAVPVDSLKAAASGGKTVPAALR
jgi:nucleoid-associated protein YgaU